MNGIRKRFSAINIMTIISKISTYFILLSSLTIIILNLNNLFNFTNNTILNEFHQLLNIICANNNFIPSLLVSNSYFIHFIHLLYLFLCALLYILYNTLSISIVHKLYLSLLLNMLSSTETHPLHCVFLWWTLTIL